MSIWYADGALALLLAWRFYADRFASLNHFADGIERDRMPPWFRWEARGDWITWVHHTLWAVLLTTGGAALGWVLGDWHQGAQHFALIAASFYVVREGFGIWKHRQLTFDSMMDVAGPVLLAVILWL